MVLIYRWMVGEWGVCDVVGQAISNGQGTFQKLSHTNRYAPFKNDRKQAI